MEISRKSMCSHRFVDMGALSQCRHQTIIPEKKVQNLVVSDSEEERKTFEEQY